MLLLEGTLHSLGWQTAQSSTMLGAGTLGCCTSGLPVCAGTARYRACICFSEEQELSQCERIRPVSSSPSHQMLDGFSRSPEGQTFFPSHPRTTDASTNAWVGVSWYKSSELALLSELGRDESVLWKHHRKRTFD